MKKISTIKWIASFDMEPLISSILKIGITLSIIPIVIAFFLYECGGETSGFASNLKARSIPTLILSDLQYFHMPGFWVQFLVHIGFSILLLIPYSRVLASFIYFIFIERSLKHALFTALVLVVLTIGLFTSLV